MGTETMSGNGTGAILESDMPFENNVDTIDLSKIQNKKVQTQVNDTVDFPSYNSTEDKTQIKQQMKEHIKNYGGIDAGIYGAARMVLKQEYRNHDRVSARNGHKTKVPEIGKIKVI